MILKNVIVRMKIQIHCVRGCTIMFDGKMHNFFFFFKKKITPGESGKCLNEPNISALKVHVKIYIYIGRL